MREKSSDAHLFLYIWGLKMKHEMLKHEMLDAGAFHGKIDISKQLLAFGRFVIYLMAIKVKKKYPKREDKKWWK